MGIGLSTSSGAGLGPQGLGFQRHLAAMTEVITGEDESREMAPQHPVAALRSQFNAQGRTSSSPRTLPPPQSPHPQLTLSSGSEHSKIMFYVNVVLLLKKGGKKCRLANIIEWHNGM